ncbi:MAG: response regulator [Anaerolineales bacterium]
MNPSDRITVFLAEGEKHVSSALTLMLEHQPKFEVHGKADTAESLLAQVCVQPPDVILLDWNLPGLNPQRLFPALRQCCPGTLIVVSSVIPEQKTVHEYQLDGFVSKQLPPKEFIAELLAIISG